MEGKIEEEIREKREANFTLDADNSAKAEDNNFVEADDNDIWVLYYNGTGMKHSYSAFCAYSANSVKFLGADKSCENFYLFTPEFTTLFQII